jgi:DNA polymerase III alpha subunit (gram-positive type)
MSNKEIYVSTDIETDGPIPGVNSMLSFASAAYDEAGRQRGVFEANLETLPGAEADPRTMAWWHGQPRAWEACRANQQPPAQAMDTYVDWIAALPGKPVFVAYPLLFDMMFMHWYLIRFTGSSPFSHSGIDIKTMAYVAMGAKSYRAATKRNMPRRWLPRKERHTHVALDDAREQGKLFLNIRKEMLQRFGSAF